MARNVFENHNTPTGTAPAAIITAAQFSAMVEDSRTSGSLKKSVLAHATTYGIENIDLLFPEAHELNATPQFIKRRTEWVNQVLNGARHTPFAKIKTTFADITGEEARALGYPEMGAQKRDEWFTLLNRETGPTTVYKKQRFDRDNLLDIANPGTLGWVKGEMRLMLDEEIARSILITDGRAVDSPDKIKEGNLRPIYKDADLYVNRYRYEFAITQLELIDELISSREDYRGAGSPAMFITTKNLNKMLLLRDSQNRRL